MAGGFGRAQSLRSNREIDKLQKTEGALITHVIKDEGIGVERIKLYTDFYSEDSGNLERKLIATSPVTDGDPVISVNEELLDVTRTDLVIRSEGANLVYFSNVRFTTVIQPNALTPEYPDFAFDTPCSVKLTRSDKESYGSKLCLYTLEVTCRGQVATSAAVCWDYQTIDVDNPLLWYRWTEGAHVIEEYNLHLSDISDFKFCADAKDPNDTTWKRPFYATTTIINNCRFLDHQEVDPVTGDLVWVSDSPDSSNSTVWKVEIFHHTAISTGNIIEVHAYSMNQHWANVWFFDMTVGASVHYPEDAYWTGWQRLDGGTNVHYWSELFADKTREELRLKSIEVMTGQEGAWRDIYQRLIWDPTDSPDPDIDEEFKVNIDKIDDSLYEMNAYWLEKHWMCYWISGHWYDWVEVPDDSLKIEVSDLDDCTWQPGPTTIGFRAYLRKTYTAVGGKVYTKGWYEIVYDEKNTKYIWQPVADAGIHKVNYETYFDPNETNQHTLIQWVEEDPEKSEEVGLIKDIVYVADKRTEGSSTIYFWRPASSQNVPIGSLLSWPGKYKTGVTRVIPEGYMEADGSYRSPAAYPELFDVIGYTYGKRDADGFFKIPHVDGSLICYKGYSVKIAGNLADLNDVNLEGITNGDVLNFDTTTRRWEGGPVNRVNASYSDEDKHTLKFRWAESKLEYSVDDEYFWRTFNSDDWTTIYSGKFSWGSEYGPYLEGDWKEIWVIYGTPYNALDRFTEHFYNPTTGAALTKDYQFDHRMTLEEAQAFRESVEKYNLTCPDNFAVDANCLYRAIHFKDLKNGERIRVKQGYYNSNFLIVLGKKQTSTGAWDSIIGGNKGNIVPVTIRGVKAGSYYGYVINDNLMVVGGKFSQSTMSSEVEVCILPSDYTYFEVPGNNRVDVENNRVYCWGQGQYGFQLCIPCVKKV